MKYNRKILTSANATRFAWFLFGGQTSDRNHGLQNLTRENSPRVTQIKSSQLYPKSRSKANTSDLSRFVDAKRHKLRIHRDSWLVPLLLIITTVKIWYAVIKEYGLYLIFLFLLGKQPSSQSMYSSGVIFPAEHSSRFTSASYFHFLKSASLIWLTFTRAE